MSLVSLSYFSLLVMQWNIFIPGTTAEHWLMVINTVLIALLTFFLKNYDFGVHAMGIGFASIFCYIVFLGWVWGSAPQGYQSVRPVGEGSLTLMALTQSAMGIQNFFIPVIKKHPNPENYSKIVLFAFIGFGGVYLYTCIAGSLGTTILSKGIVNREKLSAGQRG